MTSREEREEHERAYFEKMSPTAPTVEKVDSPVSDSVERHPAYAQIGASRVSGSANLYGSDFEHQHYVTITIRRSELHRGLSNDMEFARDELIEVALSEAQWATFVSTLNSGMGTQCTLLHVDRVPVHRIAVKTDRREQIKAEANENLAEIVRDLKALQEEIGGRARKTIMRDLVSGVIAQFGSHSGIAFIAKQFAEHIEKTVERGKIEVNAYIERRIHSAGLTAIAGEKSPISLPGTKKDQS